MSIIICWKDAVHNYGFQSDIFQFNKNTYLFLVLFRNLETYLDSPQVPLSSLVGVKLIASRHLLWVANSESRWLYIFNSRWLPNLQGKPWFFFFSLFHPYYVQKIPCSGPEKNANEMQCTTHTHESKHAHITWIFD